MTQIANLLELKNLKIGQRLFDQSYLGSLHRLETHHCQKNCSFALLKHSVKTKNTLLIWRSF